MTDAEIRSNNVTIAKFMDNWTDHGQEPAYAVYNHKGYEAWELKYHESWDWLMPVVKEINKLRSKHPLMVSDVMLSYSRLDITELYERVVYFINWYNDRSK